MTLTIWFKDGSIMRDMVLAAADLKIGGLSFDVSTLDKVDDAFLYTKSGSKIYRDRVTGTLDVNAPGIAGALKLDIAQISELIPDAAASAPVS